MKRKVLSIISGLAAFGLLALGQSGAAGLNGTDNSMKKGESIQNGDSKNEGATPLQGTMRVNDLIGKDVESSNGDKLGKITNLAVESGSGQVVYAIVSTGGRLYPVPPGALLVKPGKEDFILNADKERFLNGPSFTKNDKPDLGDITYGNKVHDYYGVAPFWGGNPGPETRLDESEFSNKPAMPPGHPPVGESPGKSKAF